MPDLNPLPGDVDVCSYVFDGDFVDRGVHQVEVSSELCEKIVKVYRAEAYEL